jgi:hypothetical protein
VDQFTLQFGVLEDQVGEEVIALECETLLPSDGGESGVDLSGGGISR